MKKVLVATILTVALTGLAIVPSAKADSFVYHVTTTGCASCDLDVTFDLPSFENPANGITTFVSGTFDFQPIVTFGISGNSSSCDDGNGLSLTSGPCWVATNTFHHGVSVTTVPSFNGLGTFTASNPLFGTSTTVTITEVVGAPEPSSLALLPLGLVALLLVRKRTSHPSAA